MSKKCTPLWREAHLEVKVSKHLVFGPLLDDPMAVRCQKSARRCGEKHIWKSKVSKTMGFEPLFDDSMAITTTTTTRESADSPPCNCRQLFSAMLKLKCSKPCVFHIFHLSKAFSKVHFVLRGPIQNSANAFSSRRNTQFFSRREKKLGICILR